MNMKLMCEETNKKTKLSKNEFGELDVDSAADRLIQRDWPGYVSGVLITERDNTQISERRWFAEVVRSVGDMTEHTGKYVYFRVV